MTSADPSAWLESVELIINPAEREIFLALSQEYQRQAFIERFWKTRDPDPQAGRNEFRHMWHQRLEQAQRLFGELTGDRAHALLLLGPPRHTSKNLCSARLAPNEVWYYPRSEFVNGQFYLIFRVVGRQVSYWSPHTGLSGLSLGGASTSPFNRNAAELLADCLDADQMLRVLGLALDGKSLEEQIRKRLQRDPEWAQAFRQRLTDLSESTEPLSASVSVSFPGKRQHRTIVQGLLSVPAAQLIGDDNEDSTTYEFLLNGEVLREGRLFESFRYYFQLPRRDYPGDSIPLVIQRYLRPGTYRWILKLDELNTERGFRQEMEINVPAAIPKARKDLIVAQSPAAVSPFAEAIESLPTSAHTLKLRSANFRLQVGKARVEALLSGDDVAKVTFELNGRRVMSKTRPPYSVELDLGRTPRTHTVTALAISPEGQLLAQDGIVLNAGPHRFTTRLLEPRRGGHYRQSLQAHAEVDVPPGELLERLEFYLNDDLVATLYQPPFVQPILLPPGGELTYVRAVAVLSNGSATEDLVYVNAPRDLEILDVRLTELYATVTDRRGEVVDDLSHGDFSVYEDGELQTIKTVELVTDRPLYAGILLDTSTSMEEQLSNAVYAAKEFFENIITPRDRATVITFNDTPDMEIPFTSNLQMLGESLEGLRAEGETTLYDSLIYSLYYFAGLGGKRCLVVLTDGMDSRSTYTYNEALEYARHTGVTIFTIGLNLPTTETEARIRLDRLAHDTGGRSFYIDRVPQLRRIYESIETELRSQYLVAYHSSQDLTTDTDRFRRVELRLNRPGLKARTIRGYYP